MSDVSFRYFLVLLFMAIDILSGVVCSVSRGKELKSSIMRNGLFKKVGILCVLFMSDGLALISVRYFTDTINITLYVFLYVIAMESISICENVADENVTNIIRKFFKMEDK